MALDKELLQFVESEVRQVYYDVRQNPSVAATPADAAQLVQENLESSLTRGTGFENDPPIIPSTVERLEFWKHVSLLYLEALLIERRNNDENPEKLWPQKIR